MKLNPTNYRAPSKKALIDRLHITPEQAETVRKLIRGELHTRDEKRFPRSNTYFDRCYHQPNRLTRILECLNEALETHGVEPLGHVDFRDGPPAEYLNTGDTYTATLLFDHGTDTFKLTSWGDWLEKNEKKSWSNQF
jgi:hypothetical protein